MDAASVRYESRANLQRNPRAIEAAGGRLALTGDALTFHPHALNYGVRQQISIPLGQLRSATPIRQRIFGFIPSPLANAILLVGSNGQPFNYVVIVPDRDRWLREIGTALSTNP